MGCNDRGGGFFGINVGPCVGVDRILYEGVLLQRDVVETNALEPVIDTVSPIVIGLEVEVDINR